MEGEVKRDAETARIDKSIDSILVNLAGVLRKMGKINARLLPPTPTCDPDDSSAKAGPQGWLADTLKKLGHAYGLINLLRSEVNTLADAVEADKIKKEEVLR